ncbi:MAG TPA: alpha/beta hydrolase [Myxococcota bacterium]|nr:alpha/beta hydrolase [Myxococcota bacterium]
MPSDALKFVVGLLRNAPAVAGDDVLAMRANMEKAVAAVPVPEGVTFTPVRANGVPAEWTVAAGARDEVAIVYFHGGGYVMGSLDTHRGLCARLSQAARARVLSVDYRLGPEHPHPAAVEDAVAAVRFARAGGVAPERTAIAGDSAGGGLTLATLVALRDAGDPVPAAGLCISPWTDLAMTGASLVTKAAEDPMVRPDDLRLMADAYLAGRDAKTPLASPLYADLAGLPPLLLQVGSAEVLLDDAVRVAERARKAGVAADLRVWPDMFHVWHAFAQILPEGQQAVDEMAAFFETCLA